MNRQNYLCSLQLMLLLLALLFCSAGMAQKGEVLYGTVSDASNGEPVPFATVTLKKSLIGTTTNESGQFELHLPDTLQEDELLVTFLGYAFKTYPLESVRSPLLVSLVPSSIDLKEVLIRPLPPTYYIKLAMQSKAANYPSAPFESNAYYREIIQENGNFLRSHEGVFKTYYPNFQDTLKNQHQLLLFRKANDLQELAFMKKERLKDEAKDKKRAEKSLKKGKPLKKDGKNNDKDSLKIGEIFGGPENLLKMSDIFKDPENFLDSNEFKNYTYSFAKSSSYNDVALMVIQYQSKGKVDHVREEGFIYLDIASNAIVKIESKGSYAIPTLARPVLFLMGIGVKNPTFKSSISFQKVNDRWYPNAIQFKMNIQVEKKRMFSKNDNSSFDIEGVLAVNKLKTSAPSPVELTKRFSVKKKPEEQVFNDQGLTWSEVNIIK
ncbi:MAG: carboxypeptidase-like regulatory domain-containing protein [Bacteroidia bacterium]|nr:carboxypeptidase-like regulatory domain-containing protein [Bacteroidia bacterium]